MSTGLRVLSAGARTTVQDGGFCARAQGVPRAGALDRDGLWLVNALLDNPPATEALEIAMTSPALRAEGGAVRVALGGGLLGRVVQAEGRTRRVPAWTATTLGAGDELRLDAPARGGLGLLGIGGGLDLPEIMGSRATCLTAGFGGFAGRALQAGDVLPLRGAAGTGPDRRLARSPEERSGPLRVVLGPQREWFTAAAIETFLSQPYTVSARSDRMGMRLDGPQLTHDPARRADIVSEATVPGAIQVPGSGAPIVLVADAQTTGGYAKIATVISADFSRLASAIPGDVLTFEAVTIAEAEAAARAHRAALERIAASAGRAASAGLDEARLRQANLIGGVVDMRRSDHFPDALKTG